MKKNLILGLLLSVLCVSSAVAQLPALPSLKGGLGGGISSGAGNFSDFSGWNAGGKLKLELPVLPFAIVGIADYNKFSATILNTTIKSRILELGAGVEYTLLPTPVVSPYLAVDAAMHRVNPDFGDSYTRTGFGFGVGTEIKLPLSPVSFDVEAKYRLANVIGKTTNEGSLNYVQVWAQVLFKIM